MELALPAQAHSLQDLVNRLAQELAEVRRTLDVASRKAATTGRTLEVRTQQLSETRSALALLLATLDSTTDGILALGQFGRAMHYNTRFVQMWGIPPDKLAALNEPALLAMQLSRVRDPASFLAQFGQRKSQSDLAQSGRIELTDGRVLECDLLPQRINGKRMGCVMRFHDVSERESLASEVRELRAGLDAKPA
ncbi:MAG: hypothetical protein ABI907_11415 [Ramlibacter sp.]